IPTWSRSFASGRTRRSSGTPSLTARPSRRASAGLRPRPAVQVAGTRAADVDEVAVRLQELGDLVAGAHLLARVGAVRVDTLAVRDVLGRRWRRSLGLAVDGAKRTDVPNPYK